MKQLQNTYDQTQTIYDTKLEPYDNESQTIFEQSTTNQTIHQMVSHDDQIHTFNTTNKRKYNDFYSSVNTRRCLRNTIALAPEKEGKIIAYAPFISKLYSPSTDDSIFYNGINFETLEKLPKLKPKLQVKPKVTLENIPKLQVKPKVTLENIPELQVKPKKKKLPKIKPRLQVKPKVTLENIPEPLQILQVCPKSIFEDILEDIFVADVKLEPSIELFYEIPKISEPPVNFSTITEIQSSLPLNSIAEADIAYQIDAFNYSCICIFFCIFFSITFSLIRCKQIASYKRRMEFHSNFE